MELTAAQITGFVGAQTLVAARDERGVVSGVCWDSRLVRPGVLFVALAGESFDGHSFVAQAFELGAAAVLVSRAVGAAELEAAWLCGGALLLVDDGVAALQRLAAGYRRMLGLTVVGITGSSGKTSTREFVAAVVQEGFEAVASAGNQNNEIGLPATVLAAGPSTQVLVVEMAMRGLGQIAQLCEIAGPDVGVITNVGTAHLELLGSRENIARAKAELIEALPEGRGVAVLNGDDLFMPFVVEVARAQARGVSVVTYGLEAHNDVRATGIAYDRNGCASFELCVGDVARQGLLSYTGCVNSSQPLDSGSGAGVTMGDINSELRVSTTDVVQVRLGVPGRHSVYNALAAVAVGLSLGMPIELIVQGLEGTRAAPMRQAHYALDNGMLVIDDTYNANPDSMRAALEVLGHLDAQRPHVAVLGDMGELGPRAAELHHELGGELAGCGVDALIVIGKAALGIAQGALEAGMDPAGVFCCAELDEVMAALRQFEGRRAIVLVKASRSMGLERVVELLIAQHGGGDGTDAGGDGADAGGSETKGEDPRC